MHFLSTSTHSHINEIKIMTYELSPGLTQVLAFCRKAMQEKALSDISTDCLLLGLLHDERSQAMQMLQSLSCPIEELKQQIMARLDSLQKSPLPSSEALVLSIESRRLLRLTLLEARRYGEEMANACCWWSIKPLAVCAHFRIT